ncbi:Hypothetical predicted protein, partial [Paramuricea clavata]
LSDFKEHVTFSGDFSYSRRVSTFKRVAKTCSPDRADARRIIPACRLEPFAIRRNQDMVSVVADTSVEMSVVSMQQQTVPVDSPAVVTSNRYALLADEADELAAPDPVSSVVVPAGNLLQPSSTNSAISDAPADSTAVSIQAQPVVDDLASLAGTIVDPLASPLPTDGAAEPVGSTPPSVDQIPAGTQPPVPCGESVAAACQSSAIFSLSEPSLQLHLSRSEQCAEPVASLSPPVSGAVEPSPPSTPVTHTPVCTTPPVSSCEPTLEDAASSAA